MKIPLKMDRVNDSYPIKVDTFEAKCERAVNTLPQKEIDLPSRPRLLIVDAMEFANVVRFADVEQAWL